ncbi:MAG: alpha-amylase [Phycisphaerales bacterium]|nr:alpha-amylase [Phycisphaerales bacterium]
MPSVCMYFQIHQPFRLRKSRIFDSPGVHEFFDTDANSIITQKVARKCYLPANALLLELIERHAGRFRVAMSITGTVVEQMRLYAPDALESFQRLVRTGCVELLGETYYHSLAAVRHEEEFRAQVAVHREMCRNVFGVEPAVFRNTELIYDDRIGRLASEMGFKAVMAEGADDILGWRSPNYVYTHPQCPIRLMLRNYRLSDDVAFRFSDRRWSEFPLTADRFANWVHQTSGNGTQVNLFMDFETFGEHQWEDTGIFHFFRHFPDALFTQPDWNFATPSEVVAAYAPAAELSVGRTMSWADAERDLSAWAGNRIQQAAMDRLYGMRDDVLATGDAAVIDAWRKLQTSDHLYYMSTKCAEDGAVHSYFSPFGSPYDAFISLQNAMHHLERIVGRNASLQTKTEDTTV